MCSIFFFSNIYTNQDFYSMKSRLVSFIKEKFVADYDIRELTLIAEKKEIEINTNIDIQSFESVDQIVSSQIVNIDSDQFDKNLLLNIYNSL